MANTKSSKKRAVTNEKRRQKNVARRSDVKSATKKILTALTGNNLDITAIKALLKEAESKIAKAKGKGVLKKNTASRKISRLAQKVAAAEKTQSKK